MTGTSAPEPHGWARVERGAATGLAVAVALPWLTRTLEEHGTVDDWAQACADPRSGDVATGGGSVVHGRGGIRVVPAAARGPDGRTHWAVRHYRRGGAVAGYLDDRYLAVGAPRPEAEITASVEARARGIRTPAVVAGAWYRSGPFYRADLVTELVPDATSLATVLFSEERRSGREASLDAAGRLAAELGRCGIHHADLNAMNVLETSDPVAAGTWVVDLDRASVSDPGGAREGRRMLARLERSLRKLERATGRHLHQAEWSALLAGFEGSG